MIQNQRYFNHLFGFTSFAFLSGFIPQSLSMKFIKDEIVVAIDKSEHLFPIGEDRLIYQLPAGSKFISLCMLLLQLAL